MESLAATNSAFVSSSFHWASNSFKMEHFSLGECMKDIILCSNTNYWIILSTNYLFTATLYDNEQIHGQACQNCLFLTATVNYHIKSLLSVLFCFFFFFISFKSLKVLHLRFGFLVWINSLYQVASSHLCCSKWNSFVC